MARIWDRIVTPSTRAFWIEARRTQGYSFFDFVHGYVYGRWPYLYIGVGTGEHRLARIIAPLAGWLIGLLPARNGPDGQPLTWGDNYHGKAVPLEAVRELVMIDEPVRLTNLETIIPFARARDIIMNHPDHIVVMDCPCRAGREHPCLPMDVCLVVGEPFASFVAEHHPRRSRWITSQEAVAILEAEDARGHVHHAFFKDAMLGRFYAICNCCTCCCGAIQAQMNGAPMLASSGYLSRVDTELCSGCETCAPFCQFQALSIAVDGCARVDETQCMGCGVCVSKCPEGALSLVRDARRGEPLEIRALMAQIDL
jgi:ferredoxin